MFNLVSKCSPYSDPSCFFARVKGPKCLHIPTSNCLLAENGNRLPKANRWPGSCHWRNNRCGCRAGRGDLDAALAIATTGFETWKAVSAFDRSKMMRRAADLVRQRADHIARMMTLEQGKPLRSHELKRLRALTLSTGLPKKLDEPMAASFHRDSWVSLNWSTKSRLELSPHLPRGIFQ